MRSSHTLSSTCVHTSGMYAVCREARVPCMSYTTACQAWPQQDHAVSWLREASNAIDNCHYFRLSKRSVHSHHLGRKHERAFYDQSTVAVYDPLRPARCPKTTVQFIRTEPSQPMLENVLRSFPLLSPIRTYKKTIRAIIMYPLPCACPDCRRVPLKPEGLTHPRFEQTIA
jgi:hypothetical protein